ncbi:class I SAM-dependent methyltransferase [Pseudomonas fluorescens]|uniref:class I SAM-dependent methyltransferase n=1 Tax=Pseudomonas fluorescens TaxID=294 RepID=UPI001BB16D9B|nr:class I SAM-dependent methyltransferase [Pseudomonas fluorescens]
MNSLDNAALINNSMLIAPRRNVLSAWTGHVPFAGWLMQTQKPRVFVELGTHLGMSYFAFCQSAVEGNIDTRCYAVDTWEGDAHAGFYNDNIFNEIASHNEEHFSAFSRLIRQRFDDAALEFADGSIDLLHIDGFHTYEAVSHDFETWKSKLSDRAVVIFHDINVRDSGFGVWRFWEEITKSYPHFRFDHYHGLGVLLVGTEQNAQLKELCNRSSEDGKFLKSLYSRLGEVPSLRYQLGQAAQRIYHLESSNNEAAAEIARLNEEIVNLTNDHQTTLANEIVRIKNLEELRVASLKNSTSWKLTAPLRKLIALIKR